MGCCGRLARKMISCCTGENEAGPFKSAEEVLKEAKPTDLIEFPRNAYVHWGMYVGFDCIIHLCNLTGGKGMVEEKLLIEVAEGGKCRVNNKTSQLTKYATMDGFDAIKSNDQIIEDARKWIYPESSEEAKYSLPYQNCEHVCTKWKYGVSESEQVNSAAKIVLGTTAGGVVGAAATGAAVAAGEAAADAGKEEAKAKADEERRKAEEAAKANMPKLW